MNIQAFHICLFLSFIGLAVCYTTPECKIKSDLLIMHVNPNYFWYCNESTPFELPCPEGSGFLSNKERSGCIPYDDWHCTADKIPSCTTEEESSKIYRHKNPNKYWGCPEPNGLPVEGNCPPGSGFVDNKDNLGCVPYDVWVCNQAGDNTRE